jgi:hypothetical protein
MLCKKMTSTRYHSHILVEILEVDIPQSQRCSPIEKYLHFCMHKYTYIHIHTVLSVILTFQHTSAARKADRAEPPETPCPASHGGIMAADITEAYVNHFGNFSRVSLSLSLSLVRSHHTYMHF